MIRRLIAVRDEGKLTFMNRVPDEAFRRGEAKDFILEDEYEDSYVFCDVCNKR